MKVAAFLKYGSTAASTRQRLLQYIPALHEAGIDLRCSSLIGNEYLSQYAVAGRARKLSVAGDYLARLRELRRARDADLIWIHCELFPYLPARFETDFLPRGVPVVLDFDDAIFHMYDLHRSPLVRRALGRKLQPLMRAAAACACGNAYLQDYALRFCDHSIVLPTVVDTDRYRPDPATRTAGPPVIGWIGSPSTFAYLAPILPLLRTLVREGRARVRFIGAGVEPGAYPEFEFTPWTEESEIASVQGIDIGVMPLPDDPWARGKCGYKLIQYLACEVPVVASPVGVNRDIVTDDVDGWLAADLSDWEKHLRQLLDDAGTRERFGAAGRARIVRDYSLRAHAPRMVALLRSAAKAFTPSAPH